MRKKGIRGLTKQLTALMLTAAMVLGPVGGSIQSTAASQDSTAVTAVEKTEKSAVDTADEAKAEAADKQEAKAESKTEQKTEQVAAVQSAAQKADTKQDTKDSQQAAETNTKTDASKDNDDKESAAKDTANADASGKADSKSDAADANSKSDDKQTVSDKADNADAKQGSVDTGDSKQSTDSDSSKDNTADASDAKQTSEQTVVSPAKDGKTETADTDKKSEQSDANEKDAEKKASEEKDIDKEVEKETEKDAELSEAFSVFKSVDGVIITVSAPEGVVPTGTKLHAKKVSKQATLDKVNEAIGEASETEETAEPDYVFDIKLVYNGEEIEPDTSYGDVNVTFTLDKADVKDSNKISVYHIKEQDETLTANAIADLKVSQDTLPDAASKTQLAKKETTSISFDTESFSYFALKLKIAAETEESYKITLDYDIAPVWLDWTSSGDNGTYYYLNENNDSVSTAYEDTAYENAQQKTTLTVIKGKAVGNVTGIGFAQVYDEDVYSYKYYKLSGWTEVEDSSKTVNLSSYKPSSDITFKAKWTEIDVVNVSFAFLDRKTKDQDYRKYICEKGSRLNSKYVQYACSAAGTGSAKKWINVTTDSEQKYSYIDICNLIINEDTEFEKDESAATYKKYKVTVNLNNGTEATEEIEVSEGGYYAFDDELDFDSIAPENADYYKVYTDADFTKSLDDYLKEKNGYCEDLDVYLKWFYKGGWVDNHTKYKYTDGTYAADTLVNDGDDIYYVGSDKTIVKSKWISVPSTAEDYNDYGIEKWYFYFGNDGKAYRTGINSVDGQDYLFHRDGRRMVGYVHDDSELLEDETEDIDDEDTTVELIYYAKYSIVDNGTEDDRNLRNADYICGKLSDANDPDVTKNALSSGWVDHVLKYDYDIFKAGDTIRFYFDPKSYLKVKNRAATIDGEKYTFDFLGICKKISSYKEEWKCVDRYYMYKLSNGEYAKDTLIYSGYNYYYVDSDGHMVANQWIAIPSEKLNNEDLGQKHWWFYFGSEGKAYRKSRGRTIDGLKYGFDEDGCSLFGFVDDGSYCIHSNEEDPALCSDYYYGSVEDYNRDTHKGYNSLYTGWLECTADEDINDDIQKGDIFYVYYDLDTGRKLVNTSREIDGVTYSFDEAGISNRKAKANYKVEHYKQSVDGTSYEKVEADTDTLEGKVGGSTEAKAKSYEGFTPKLVVNKKIAADSETVVEIKYDRNKYSINFNMNGHGSQVAAVEQYYEGNVSAPTAPAADGYFFAGWYKDAECTTEYGFSTMPLNGITVYAKWTEMEVKATAIDTSKVEFDTDASANVHEALSQISANTAAAAPATTLATAVDTEKFTAKVRKATPTEFAADSYAIKNVELALKVDTLSIEESADKSITKIEYEVKPYANVAIAAIADEGTTADEKTITDMEVSNDLLNGKTIDVKLPIVSESVLSSTAKYVNVLHEFSDGGSESFTSRISGKGNDRYVAFNVSKFSKFTLTFTDAYYEIADISPVAYTGKKLKPGVKVTIGGETVDASKYNVYYTNNLNAGTATAEVYIKSTGDTITKSFEIIPATPVITASDVNVTYDGAAHAANGRVSIPNGITLPNKHLKVKYFTDADCTEGESDAAPSKVGTYYALLYVDETDNYDYAEKIVKITINAKSSSGGSSSGTSSGGSSGGSSSGGNSSSSHSSGGSSSGGSGGGGGAYSSGVAALKFGAGSTAALVPDKGIAGTWKKNELGKWTFTSNDKHEYSYEWAYIANPNADTAKGQEAASWFRFGTDGTMLTGWYKNVYGDWYYLNPISDNTMGAMLKGWQYINGYWYYLEEKEAASLGRLYVSKQTPDGKTVDAEGRWVKNGAAVTDANTKPTA